MRTIQKAVGPLGRGWAIYPYPEPCDPAQVKPCLMLAYVVGGAGGGAV